MDQDQSSNQEETTAKVEDKGKIDKLEKELDVIGEKAQKEIADKPPVQPKAAPVQPQQDQTQNAPASQPTQQPSTPPAEAKQGGMNKVLKIALILLVFSVFVAVIYFGKDYFLQLTTKSTPSPVPTSTATPDPTADWETYTNTNFGFSINYPVDWEFTEGTTAEATSSNSFTWGLSDQQAYFMHLHIFDNPEQLTSEQYVDNVISNNSEGPGTLVYESIEESTINEMAATVLTKVFTYDQYEDQTHFSSGSKIYRFSIPVAEENPNLVDPIINNSIANLILSTFEFTEATSSATPISTPSGTLD